MALEAELNPLLNPRELHPRQSKFLILLPLSLLIIIIAGISYSFSIINERFYLNGACATDNKICSRMCVKILKDKGNAVDAGIAAAICLGTVNSFASGIGGGGFAIVGGNTETPQFFNFREKAPAASYPEMFVNNPIEAQIGAKSVGVPGELLGLWKLHIKYGDLEWKDLISPSIKLAEKGFPAHELLIRRLSSAKDGIVNDQGLSKVYTKVKDGVKILIEEGDLVYRQNYAETLKDISKNGIKNFYFGETAQILVDFLKSNGGVLTLEDFGNFTVTQHATLHLNYNGYDIHTSNLPSGGPVLGLMLKIMEHFQYPSGKAEDIDYQRLIESMKWGYAQRSYFGDPEFVKNASEIVSKILDANFIDQIPQKINDYVTFEPKYCILN
eukprot:NODE_1096_length_2224_cov_0.576000.p1 type:complete len:385 gc:universal NODE_1096_length_2224_cov_0.576000:665-1819(+)